MTDTGFTYPSTVAAPALCRGCRYDLRGLAVTGRCPECGEGIEKSVPRCPRCDQAGAKVVALREVVYAATPTTPTPSTAPTAPATSGVPVWECPECHGVGFEPGRLAPVVDEHRHARPPARPLEIELLGEMSVWCRGCERRMVGIRVDHAVTVDRCPNCALLWLDAGELPAVVWHIRKYFGSASVPRSVEEVIGDTRALQRKADARRGLSSLKDGVSSGWWAAEVGVDVIGLLARISMGLLP